MSSKRHTTSGSDNACARSLTASSSGALGRIHRAGRVGRADASVVTVSSGAVGVQEHAARFTNFDLAGSGHHVAALQWNRSVAVSARSAAQSIKRLRPLAADAVVLAEHWAGDRNCPSASILLRVLELRL